MKCLVFVIWLVSCIRHARSKYTMHFTTAYSSCYCRYQYSTMLWVLWIKKWIFISALCELHWNRIFSPEMYAWWNWPLLLSEQRCRCDVSRM